MSQVESNCQAAYTSGDIMTHLKGLLESDYKSTITTFLQVPSSLISDLDICLREIQQSYAGIEINKCSPSEGIFFLTFSHLPNPIPELEMTTCVRDKYRQYQKSRLFNL